MTGNITNYDLMLFPSIFGFENSSEGLLDMVLRKDASKLVSKSDSILAVILAPSSDQSAYKINQNNFYLRKDPGHWPKIPTNWKKHEVRISDCFLTLHQNSSFTDSSGEPIQGNLSISSFQHIKCHPSSLNSMIKSIQSNFTALKSATRSPIIYQLESNILSLFSSPIWSNCDWFIKHSVNWISYKQPTLGVTNCYAEPGTKSFNNNPCCNPFLRNFLCCYPRDRNITYEIWNGTLYSPPDSLITASNCPAFTSSETNTSLALDFGAQARVVYEYSVSHRRKLDKEFGCSSIPWFNRAVENVIREIFDLCELEIYGNYGMSRGIGQRCTKNEDCWSFDCNLVKGRCEVPFENPENAWANCINANQQQWIKPIFNQLLGLETNASVTQISDVFTSSFRTSQESCMGPNLNVSTNSTKEICLKDKYCNWDSCSNDMFNHTCLESCLDPVLSKEFCGICPDEYGQCLSLSEQEGCLVNAIDDPTNCKNQGGIWAILERRCYLPGQKTRNDCVKDKVCLPVDMSSQELSLATYYEDEKIRKSNMQIASKLKVASKLNAASRTTLNNEIRSLSSSSSPSSSSPSSSSPSSSQLKLQSLPQVHQPANLNWNRTICPTVCYSDYLKEAECHDTECDNPCCDPSHTCTDPQVRKCTCEIDSFCCDSWDDICNQRAIQDGCVACNCVRRKWNPLLNNRQGLCTILFPSQEYCEDPFRGNGTWWNGRTWQAGRFATQERCSQGACDYDISLPTNECPSKESCKGVDCVTCATERPPSDPKHAEAQQICSRLSTLECLQCEKSLSSCKENQTLAQCRRQENLCPTREKCLEAGFCDDYDLLAPIGGCFYEARLDASGFPTCNFGSKPLQTTVLGCQDLSIRDPANCKGEWHYPAFDKKSCESHGVLCRQLRKNVFGIDIMANTFRHNCEQCVSCGGSCEPLFEWKSGSWSKGTSVALAWTERAYKPFNKWTATIDIQKVRMVMEEAIARRKQESLITDFGCRSMTQASILSKFESICKSSALPSTQPIPAPTTPEAPVSPPITPEVPVSPPTEVPTSLPPTEDEFDFDEDDSLISQSSTKTSSSDDPSLNGIYDAKSGQNSNMMPNLVIQRRLYSGMAQQITASPFTLNIPSQSIDNPRKSILVTVESIPMYSYWDWASKAGREHKVMDAVRQDGFIAGRLIGGGVRVNITEAPSIEPFTPSENHILDGTYQSADYSASALVLRRVQLSSPADLCLDVDHPSTGLWLQFFPKFDLAFPIDVPSNSSLPKDPKSQYDKPHFAAMNLDSQSLKVLDQRPYSFRMCIKISNSTTLLFPAMKTQSFPSHILLIVFTIAFYLAAIAGFVQAVFLFKKDPSQQRIWKSVTHTCMAIVCVIKGTHFLLITHTRWQRMYPEDLVAWFGFEWPAYILLSTAITLYLFSRDDEPRLKGFRERMPAWIGVFVLTSTIGIVALCQIVSYFPTHLPTHQWTTEWSLKLIDDINHMESLFTWILVVVTGLGLLLSGVWSFFNKMATASRISIVVVALLSLICYAHILVWLYYEDESAGYSVWWINTFMIAGEQLLIAIACIFTLNETAGLEVATKEELLEAERLSLARRKANNWRSKSRTTGAMDDYDFEPDMMEYSEDDAPSFNDVDYEEAPRTTQHTRIMREIDRKIDERQMLKRDIDKLGSTWKGSYSRYPGTELSSNINVPSSSSFGVAMSPNSEVGSYMEANASFSDVEFREEEAEEETDVDDQMPLLK